MIKLSNLLIWDDNMNPVRVPRIDVDPVALEAAGEDGWIVCGPYRLRIIVEGGGGKELTIKNTAGQTIRSSMSGCIFLDQSSFEIGTAKGYSALGHLRGCIDVSWP